MEYYNDAETREKLQQLRDDIILNSLYTSDYENSFDIPADDVQNFFDGYIDFLGELEEEDYEEGRRDDRPSMTDIGDFLDQYDTIDHLENWYDIVQGGGCAAFDLDEL